jgi:L-lactate dehydrogenase complex protein LldG
MDTVSTFEESLDGQSTVHRTTAADLAATLESAIDPPAVGTRLPFEGVSLAETAVEVDPDLDAIEAATTGVTAAGLGVAEYGTVTIVSSDDSEELVSLYANRHVAVLAASDLVRDMPSAYERIGEDVAAGSGTRILATGPSATADMGELIRGVHGPHETHVVVLEDR